MVEPEKGSVCVCVLIARAVSTSGSNAGKAGLLWRSVSKKVRLGENPHPQLSNWASVPMTLTSMGEPLGPRVLGHLLVDRPQQEY